MMMILADHGGAWPKAWTCPTWKNTNLIGIPLIGCRFLPHHQKKNTKKSLNNNNETRIIK